MMLDDMSSIDQHMKNSVEKKNEVSDKIYKFQQKRTFGLLETVLNVSWVSIIMKFWMIFQNEMSR
jgi:hypothetical protein